eukprot:3117331-Rhodomonas_salina.1
MLTTAVNSVSGLKCSQRQQEPPNSIKRSSSGPGRTTIPERSFRFPDAFDSTLPMLSHFILSITDSVPAGLVGRLCASERARLTLCASQQLRGIGDANSKKFIAAGITTLDQSLQQRTRN